MAHLQYHYYILDTQRFCTLGAPKWQRILFFVLLAAAKSCTSGTWRVHPQRNEKATTSKTDSGTEHISIYSVYFRSTVLLSHYNHERIGLKSVTFWSMIKKMTVNQNKNSIMLSTASAVRNLKMFRNRQSELLIVASKPRERTNDTESMETL
jgi:hypothetical protein